MPKIRFEKITTVHLDIVFNWLSEPHMMEFWDNSQEHRDDILNFIQGKTQAYFAGTTQYWIGFIDDEPYAFILSDILQRNQEDLSEVHLANMSETGQTVSLDFGIGNKKFLGCGLAAPTLSAFMIFYKENINLKVDTFFIDPDEINPRAIRVYIKAGFMKVGQYQPKQGVFLKYNNDLMVKKI